MRLCYPSEAERKRKIGRELINYVLAGAVNLSFIAYALFPKGLTTSPLSSLSRILSDDRLLCPFMHSIPYNGGSLSSRTARPVVSAVGRVFEKNPTMLISRSVNGPLPFLYAARRVFGNEDMLCKSTRYCNCRANGT